MPDAADEQTREDAVYAAIFAFLRKNSVLIAFVAPFVVISLLPVGPVGIVLVPIVWLFEAIGYAAVQRRRGVRPADPATAATSSLRWAWRLIVIGVSAVAIVVVNRILASIGG